MRGEFIGEETDKAQVRLVDIPAYFAYTDEATCYAFQANVTAACIEPFTADEGEIVEDATTAGLYNPVYYLLVGWPSLFLEGPPAMYLMRLVSAIVSTFFVAASLTLLSTRRNAVVPLLAGAVVATPMVLFLAASVNPNALEATTALGFLVGLYFAVDASMRTGRVPWQYTLFTALSVILLLNTRGLSPLWALIVLIAVVILFGVKPILTLLRDRGVLVASAFIALASVFAVGWSLRTSSVSAVGVHAGAGTSPLNGFITMMERTFDFAPQMIGLFGWMDTPAPSYIVIVWAITAGGLVLSALTLCRGRRLAAVGFVLACFLIAPALIQASTVEQSGYIWQGRYSLPVFLVLLALAGLAVGEQVTLRPGHASVRRLTIGVLLLIGFGHVASFAFALRRYSVGSSSSWGQFVLDPGWQPPGGNAFWLGVLVVSFGLFAALIAAVALSRPAVAASEENTASPVGVAG